MPLLPAPDAPAPAPLTELLAPAGDWEALRAAVANGADAVYFGLAHFNARHRATNFAREELPRVVEFLHARNVRGYVTLNTLLFSDELPEALETLRDVVAAGVDAIIVQDLGLARLARRAAPDLAIHGSTQMTLTEPRGIEFVRRLGVERVILARELSLAEIAAIRRETDVPVEVFVHGALCVAYSGQCLTSEALGGRSANRGQCAQACRLPYDLLVDGRERPLGDVAYLLSPQDLAAHALVPRLLDLGVASLKIEGRLKSPHYVAVTTETYRAAVDAAAAGRPYAPSTQLRLDLEQSFSRGFTAGFLDGVDHQRLVEGRFPKSRGVRAGTVAGRTARGLVVAMDPGVPDGLLKPGDGVVFDEGHPEQDEQGGRLVAVEPVEDAELARAVQPRGAAAPARLVELVFMRGAVQAASVAVGSLVWRTDDPQLRRRAELTYHDDRPFHRAVVDFEARGRLGGAFTLTVRDQQGRIASATWPGPLEAARNHPLTVETLAEPCGRLGETPFALGQITLELDGPAMVPKSVLNPLRREAVETLVRLREAPLRARAFDSGALEATRAEIAARWPAAPVEVAEGNAAMARDAATQAAWYVLARSQAQLEAVVAWAPPAGCPRPAMVYCDFEDVRRYREAVEAARAGGLPIGVATLRVLKPGEEGWLRQILRAGADAVLCRNLPALEFFAAEAPELPRLGDYALNAANELTADLLLSTGLRRLTPSYDLNWGQLAALLGRIDPARFEVVVHQHMPMFHMEHCVFAHTLSDGKDHRDCGRPCDRHRVELRDRVGAEFPLVADAGCRNTVFNSVPQSAVEFLPRMRAAGLRHFRVELLRETPDEAHALLDRYARVLAGLAPARDTWRGLQVLNQLGVTRGTLERG